MRIKIPSLADAFSMFEITKFVGMTSIQLQDEQR